MSTSLERATLIAKVISFKKLAFCCMNSFKGLKTLYSNYNVCLNAEIGLHTQSPLIRHRVLLEKFSKLTTTVLFPDYPALFYSAEGFVFHLPWLFKIGNDFHTLILHLVPGRGKSTFQESHSYF